MAGILKVDRVQSDSNLAFQIGSSNVAYFNTDGINMTGNQIITGNGILRTASGMLYANSGIAFPASQSSSADANVLDDYEEGTWTPAFSRNGSAPTVTYTSRDGKYTKIGNIVTVSFRLRVLSWSGGSGEFQVSGLPFTSNNAGGDHVGISTLGYEAFVFSSSQQLITVLDNNVSFFRHLVSNSGGGWGNISDPGSGASCYGCFTYHTS
jgi:hypothetical protein